MNKKVVLIQGLLTPNRYPIFAELHKNSRWEFEVWFMGHGVKNRIWSDKNLKGYDFKYRFLKGLTINFGTKDTYPFWINPFIPLDIIRKKPDVIIMAGWDSLTSFLAHITCKIFGIKFILWSGSTESEKSWRRDLTYLLVKSHVIFSDALISYGSKAKEYLVKMGAKPFKVYPAYNTTDIQKYSYLSEKHKKNKSKLKSDLLLSNKKIILYYGQLIERKGVDILIKAFASIKKNNESTALLIAGSGPFEDNLKNLVSRLKLKDVVFIPNPGDEEICKYYSISDLFALPSREEVWGLVINEAMACGIPVVASSSCGAVNDMLVDGYNGYIFRNKNSKDLSIKIKKIFQNKNILNQLSKNSLISIQNFHPKRSASQISKAVESLFIQK